MAEDNAAAADAPEAPTRGPGLMTLVKAIAFVSVIVLIQVAAATVILPSADDARQMSEELAGAGDAEPANEEAAHEESPAPLPESKELSLGTYHVVSFNPSTGASMSIDFELFGVVLAEDEEELAERFALHEKRLNEQVTIAIRGMESVDFTDPGLGLIKRIILEKVNRALGKSLVREAVFSGFSFVER